MIGICTVVYNKLDFVKRTVEAVLKNTITPYFYVLVYNDSPYPGVKEYIESLSSQVKVIMNPSNVGVSRAYKQGFDWLKEQSLGPLHIKWFAKVDDDTIIQTSGWNGMMLRTFELFPNLGILSANIDSGKQGGNYREIKKDDHRQSPITLEVFDNPCVGGACTVYPVELFKKTGFFKDFGYYGQVDGEFANRAVQAGYFTAYLKDAHCKHLGRTNESDPLLDAWKLEAWSKRTNLEFRDWKKEKIK